MSVEFGPYVLEHMLGKGTFTRTYLAYDAFHGKHIALKLFVPTLQALLKKSVFYSCYRRGLYDATQLRHPHIVPIYDALQINGLFCYTQPLLNGTTLSDSLEAGAMSADAVVRIIDQVSVVLQFAHHQGIAHGHLSPGSLLFNRAGEVFVSDFGLCPLVNFVANRMPISSPYLSPEQLAGKANCVDMRTDVYALGRILLDIVCGTDESFPRMAPTIEELIPVNDTTMLDCAGKQLSRRWQNVFHKALAVEAEKRYQTVGELQTAVEHAVAAPRFTLESFITVRRASANRAMVVFSQARKSMGHDKRKKGVIFSAGLVLLILWGLIVINWFPYIGASIADPLRRIFGRNAIAQLEAAYFEFSDEMRQFNTEVGLVEPRIPWEVPTTIIPQMPTVLSPQLPTPTIPVSELSTSDPAPANVAPKPTISDSTTLNDVQAMGELHSEGVWQVYLYGYDDVVGWRTFLQPDAERPLSIVGIVAFDLEKTELHYVLGLNEPSTPDGPRGTGTIPELDRHSGNLLAAFNGGFKATHGYYGAMSHGVEAIPPRNDVATIAIDEGGAVEIGVWGQTVGTSATDPVLRAWRQNAQLVIENGQVNPLVYSGTVDDWGGTFTYDVVTWRSGIGLNEQRNILYYFSGPALSMPVLAEAMLAVGVHQGMLLDINEYWVHFAAIQNHTTALNASPLFEDGMDIHVDRYLNASRRDFFYVTLKK